MAVVGAVLLESNAWARKDGRSDEGRTIHRVAVREIVLERGEEVLSVRPVMVVEDEAVELDG